MTRVILVGPLPPPVNGMTVVTESLLGSTLRNEFDLRHLDTSDHRDISNIESIDLRNVLLALSHGVSFLALLVRHRPTIVHVQVARNRVGFVRDALFLIPSRLGRRRVVLHLHSRDFAGFYRDEAWWMRALVRLSISSRWHGAVLSERFRGAFDGLIPSERVFVLPNGVPDTGDGGDAGSRSPLILHLSTMWKLKGVFDVIEAADLVRERVPAARFVLAGGWFRDDERAEADELVRELKLGGTVEFTGPVWGDEKHRLFGDAAAFTLPTRHQTEGQPFVVLEALAAGTPVVATPLGAIPDMVRDGSEGFLVSEGDTRALADRLVDVLTDDALRRRLGRAARERYEREYTMPVFADRVAAIWRTVAGERA